MLNRLSGDLLVAANPVPPPAQWDNGSQAVELVAGIPTWDSAGLNPACLAWPGANVSAWRMTTIQPANAGLTRYPVLAPLQFAR